MDPQTNIDKEAGVSVSNIDTNNGTNDHQDVTHTHSTRDDVFNMQRMGKKQQLVRNFRLLSIAAFTALATAAWELGMFFVSPAVIDGGRPALIYSTIWAFIGFGPIYLSLAEMASMAPIAGAQYHWVSEFAPESCQRILSYLTGWTSTIAWQAGNALGVFLAGSVFQVIISISMPDYEYPAWHCTMLVIGSMIVAFVGVVFGSRVLPYWQTSVFVFHILGYFYFIIPQWVNAPRATHSQVWLEFTNNGGWSSMALSVFVGQLTCISGQVGLDTAVHMSEEVKDAAKQIPRAMIMVYLVNTALLFPAFVTLAYHMPSIDDALSDPSEYPAIYVLRQSMPAGAVIGLLVVVNFILITSNITYLAAVTRDLFAFARDNGLPFSNWIAKVDPRREIPVNAAILTSVIGILLSLIYIGSPVAFYALTSLCTVAFLQCYCLSIGCVLWRRIYHPETLPRASFSLGRYGIPINIAALLFSLWSFFWTFWPQVTPVTGPDMNWASAIFVGVLIVAMIEFFVSGKKNYHGPVASVEGRKVHTG